MPPPASPGIPSAAAAGAAASGAAVGEGAAAAATALEALRAQVAALRADAEATAGELGRLRKGAPAKSRASAPEKPRAPIKFEPAGNHSVRYIARQAGLGREAFRAPMTAAAVGLLKLAVQDTAGLAAVTARAKANFHSLFLGIDSTPLTRGMAMLTSGLNPAAQSGKALAGIFNDTFGGLFRLFEKIAPYGRAAFDGMVLGALYAQNTLLDLEIGVLQLALAFPQVTGAVKDILAPIDGMKVAAYGGAAGLAALGIAAGGPLAPFVALGVAIMAVNTALGQYSKLKKEWDENSAGQIKRKLGKDIGLTSDDDEQKAIQAQAKGTFEANRARAEAAQKAAGGPAGGAPSPAGGPPALATPAGGAGQATGKAYADGLVAGVQAGMPAVDASGRALANTLDASTRTAAEAHSPSRKAERTGETYPAGMVKGVDSGAGDVQAAADRSLSPKMPGAGAMGAGASSSAPMQITIINQWPDGVGATARSDIEAACEAAVYKAVRAVLGNFAIPTRLAT
jgi:hypothetical protein